MRCSAYQQEASIHGADDKEGDEQERRHSAPSTAQLSRKVAQDAHDDFADEWMHQQPHSHLVLGTPAATPL
jgi:hypothetical protein